MQIEAYHVFSRDLRVVKAAVAWYPDCVNMKKDDTYPLNNAIINKYPTSVVKCLLRHGASPNMEGKLPRWYYHMIPISYSPIDMAISKRNIPLSGLNAYRAAIDIDDLVEAYFLVIEKGVWESLIYNIGNLNLNKKEFALGIKNLIDCRISEIPDIGDLRNLQIDCTKFNSEFKFQPKFTYDQSISKIYEYLKINLDNIEANNFNELLNMPLDRWRQICSNL